MGDTVGETKGNSEVTFFYGPPHMDAPILANRQELIYISSVRTQGVVWRTLWKRWIIGTDGERERERERETNREREREREIYAYRATWWWWWWWWWWWLKSKLEKKKKIYQITRQALYRNHLLEKSKVIFFLNFFLLCKPCIVWNWFIANIILISTKYLFSGNSKWRQMKPSAPGLNRGMSLNFWWLASANYLKFTEEWVMCTQKFVLAK